MRENRECVEVCGAGIDTFILPIQSRTCQAFLDNSSPTRGGLKNKIIYPWKQHIGR